MALRLADSWSAALSLVAEHWRHQRPPRLLPLLLMVVVVVMVQTLATRVRGGAVIRWLVHGIAL